MRYRERLHVPIAWWVLGTLFALSMVPAVGFYIGPLWGIGTGVVIEGLLVWGFLVLAARIQVDEQGLRVGRGLLAWAWIGEVIALDANETRHRLGPGADVRAHLIARPYLKRAVEIRVDDDADPHPYWLVGTRHPEHLAAALGARSEGVTATGTESEPVAD